MLADVVVGLSYGDEGSTMGVRTRAIQSIITAKSLSRIVFPLVCFLALKVLLEVGVW
jgi:hypothetical protein